MTDYKLPPIPFYGLMTEYGMDFCTPEIEDVDYVDITDEQEDPGEEAYCVPI